MIKCNLGKDYSLKYSLFFLKINITTFSYATTAFSRQQIKQIPLTFVQIPLTDQTVSSTAGRNLHVATQIPSFLSFGCKVGKKINFKASDVKVK